MVSSISSNSAIQNPMGIQTSKTLTDEQKKTVQDILSKYDPENLTADDAKEIFKALREANIPPGQGVMDAIDEAGFDSKELGKLGRPDKPPQGPPPPPPDGTGQTEQSSGLDVSALKSLQELLNKYDLSNLSEEDQTDLMTQLAESGFSIDINA